MDVYVGQIIIVGFDYAPPGFSFCEGQLIDITANPTLFAVLGTRFGGDAERTFALPDLRGKEPRPGLRYAIALQGRVPFTTSALQ